MFEMGAKFDKGWSVDKGAKKNEEIEIKSFEKHQLVISKEKRKAKIVTVVQPFYLEKKVLQTLFKSLKKKLATGGAMKEQTLEFQGDVQTRLIEEFQRLELRLKGK